MNRITHDPFNKKSWPSREDDNSLPGDGSEIRVGRNHGTRSGQPDLQVFIEITGETGQDGVKNNSGAVLSTKDARELLDHLNLLLGNPLSYGAPTAG